MPARVALDEFLETGFFGPVELGMERPEVESALGPPGAEGAMGRKQREPSIWKYGSFELHFAAKTGLLERIFSDDLEAPAAGPGVALDAWGLSARISQPGVEWKLREAGIAFARTLHPWEERAGELVTCGLVALLFTVPGAGSAADAPSLTALSSTSSVIVAEAFLRQDAKRKAEEWKAAYPEIARLVPEGGWVLDSYREDDGRTLHRMRVEFAPEPQPEVRHHHH